MRNFNFDTANKLGIVFGLAGFAFAAWQIKKQDDLAKKLDTSIDELSKKTPIEISDDLVNKAVQTATDREVKAAVHKATSGVENSATATIKAEAKKAVDAATEKIAEQAGEEIAKQVADIDKNKLQTVVTKRAEDKIVNDFDHKLDSILADTQTRADNAINEASSRVRKKTDDVFKTWENISDWAFSLINRRNNNISIPFRVE